MVKGILINTNGTYHWVNTHELKDLQKLVGGYIQELILNDRFTIFVNEEAILKGLQKNVLGKRALEALGNSIPYDVYGPILMYGPLDESDVETSFPEDQLCKIEKALK
jgi:hypothetical protein